jgi:Tol biopolymer transport system component
MRADGSQRQRVGGSGAAAWSPRGSLLAFAGRYPDDAIRVGSPGEALSTWERIGAGAGPDPLFSPDGSLLAYQRRNDLVIRRVSDRSLVVHVHLDDFVFVDHMIWSSDGRSLLFDASSPLASH